MSDENKIMILTDGGQLVVHDLENMGTSASIFKVTGAASFYVQWIPGQP
jgi:hypothetical protein